MVADRLQLGDGDRASPDDPLQLLSLLKQLVSLSLPVLLERLQLLEPTPGIGAGARSELGLQGPSLPPQLFQLPVHLVESPISEGSLRLLLRGERPEEPISVLSGSRELLLQSRAEGGLLLQFVGDPLLHARLERRPIVVERLPFGLLSCGRPLQLAAHLRQRLALPLALLRRSPALCLDLLPCSLAQRVQLRDEGALPRLTLLPPLLALAGHLRPRLRHLGAQGRSLGLQRLERRAPLRRKARLRFELAPPYPLFIGEHLRLPLGHSLDPGLHGGSLPLQLLLLTLELHIRLPQCCLAVPELHPSRAERLLPSRRCLLCLVRPSLASAAQRDRLACSPEQLAHLDSAVLLSLCRGEGLFEVRLRRILDGFCVDRRDLPLRVFRLALRLR
ncbi:MAG: hypothetical protein R3F14_43875 [Polyangiaceae bacterium]